MLRRQDALQLPLRSDYPTAQISVLAPFDGCWSLLNLAWPQFNIELCPCSTPPMSVSFANCPLGRMPMTPKLLIAVTAACLAFAPLAMAQADNARSTTVKSSKSNTSDRMGGG